MKYVAVALLLFVWSPVSAQEASVPFLPPPPPAAKPAKPAAAAPAEPDIKLPPIPPAPTAKEPTAPTAKEPTAPSDMKEEPSDAAVKLPPVPPAPAKTSSAPAESKVDPSEPAAKLPLPPPPPPAGKAKSAPPTPKTDEPAKADTSLPEEEAAPKLPVPPPPPPGRAKAMPSPKADEPAKADTSLPEEEAAPKLPLPPPPPPGGQKGALPPPPPPGAKLPTAKTEATSPPAPKSRTPAPVDGVKPPPVKGSHLAEDENFCIMCHANPDVWEEKTKHLYMPKEKFAADVHWKNGVNCHDCHGGNPGADRVNEAHALEDGFRGKREEIRKYCGHCHEHAALELVKGVHAKAGEPDSQNQGTLLDCGKCHGSDAHSMLSARDSNSPVFLDHQVATCGGCHEKDRESYASSAHGDGLFKSGLLVTASCADCHGAHGVYRSSDKRSTLHIANVAQTCGKCHRFIEERLQSSVHGKGKGLGRAAERVAPGGKNMQHPSCTSCHQGHQIATAESIAFRQQLPSLCGNCHGELSGQYGMSIHGELTHLGYTTAAKCSDCHGAHDILPASDPNSRLSAANREETCRKCHPSIAANTVTFDPHADHTDPSRNPILFYVYATLMTLLISTFTFFGLHTLLWLIRGLVDVFKHGRAKGLRPGQVAYVRFGTFHRTAHVFLMVSFLGLAATGLPLKYSQSPWAQKLARAMGGFEQTGDWHRIFGVLLLSCLVVYVLLMARHFREERRAGVGRQNILFDIDSPVPHWRDVKDFFRMVRWFFGLGRKPTFERWAYWEKFDFWGACADAVIIGVTGLILWFPDLFCLVLPGITVNIAKVIHSTQALLATGFVFAIHFFHAHLRPEKFPADMSILTGLVSEEELREERPEFLERLRQEGVLDELRATVPSAERLWTIRVLGWTAFGVGVALLIGILAAAVGK